jgi:hypothetical protein
LSFLGREINIMAVRSIQTRNGKTQEEEEEERKPRRPSTAVVSKGGVIGAMIFILRTMAILLIIASTFGNYVTFMGGWARWLPADMGIIGLSILYQLLCSVLQWGFKAGRMWIPYTLALVASAIPSFLTYNAWAGPYLVVQLGTVLAPVVLFAATIGADALPEWVLVE